jgi:predicted lipoprotein with Yx(FWY)xxD motif
MMTARTTLKATTTAIALAFAAAPMAMVTAQTAAAQSAESYSAEELDIFSNALLGVAEVREKYTPLLQSAKTEDQQAAIVEEANAEIKQVIEDTDGITLDRYIEISQAASEDQGLNQRIVKRVQNTDSETQ